MKSFTSTIGEGLRLAALSLPVFVLLGCASAPDSTAKSEPVPSSAPAEVIVGSGTDDQRKVISDSDERIYDAERGVSPDSPTPADAPGQGIP